MTKPKNFSNESQDARRHDQQQATHPDDKPSHHTQKHDEKSKTTQSTDNKKGK